MEDLGSVVDHFRLFVSDEFNWKRRNKTPECSGGSSIDEFMAYVIVVH